MDGDHSAAVHASPERMRDSSGALHPVPEDESIYEEPTHVEYVGGASLEGGDDDVDWELEEERELEDQGLYKGK